MNIKNLPIAKKILLMNGIVCCLVIIAFSYLWVQLKSTRQLSQDIVVQQQQLIAQAELGTKVNATFNNMRYWYTDLMATGDDKSEAMAHKQQKAIPTLLKQLSLPSSTQQQLLEQLKLTVHYNETALEALTLDELNKALSAMNKSRNTSNEVDKVLKKFTADQNETLIGLTKNSVGAAIISLEWVLIISAIVVFIAASFSGIALSRVLVPPISNAIDVAKTVADGDLTQDIKVDSTDEAGQLMASMKAMQDNVYQVISQIISSANDITNSTEEIRSGNLDLSQRTEEQAGSLSATSMRVEELAQGVAETADESEQANQLALAAVNEANSGGEIVQQVVHSMSEINQSSDEIANIVGVIDDIAFQTNLLALNAAVEAARAGDQGKGFAVVANEVRELAQRSANSAKEIKGLIQTTTDKIRLGSDLANNSGQALEKIEHAIKEVNDKVTSITNKTTSQSRGLNDIKTTLIEMDSMTQQNAAMVEELAGSANNMNENANGMVEQMHFFKLDDHNE